MGVLSLWLSPMYIFVHMFIDFYLYEHETPAYVWKRTANFRKFKVFFFFFFFSQRCCANTYFTYINTKLKLCLQMVFKTKHVFFYFILFIYLIIYNYVFCGVHSFFFSCTHIRIHQEFILCGIYMYNEMYRNGKHERHLLHFDDWQWCVNILTLSRMLNTVCLLLNTSIGAEDKKTIFVTEMSNNRHWI